MRRITSLKSSGMPLKTVISLSNPCRRAFGARAVVALDVDDQRVVQLALSSIASRMRPIW